MEESGWTLVSRVKKPIKKALQTYKGGRFHNLYEATENIAYAVDRGFIKIENLSAFEISLLKKRFGQDWKNYM